VFARACGFKRNGRAGFSAAESESSRLNKAEARGFLPRIESFFDPSVRPSVRDPSNPSAFMFSDYRAHVCALRGIIHDLTHSAAMLPDSGLCYVKITRVLAPITHAIAYAISQ